MASKDKDLMQRVNFASSKKQLEYPDFLEIQLRSFAEFFSIRNFSRIP